MDMSTYRCDTEYTQNCCSVQIHDNTFVIKKYIILNIYLFENVAEVFASTVFHSHHSLFTAIANHSCRPQNLQVMTNFFQSSYGECAKFYRNQESGIIYFQQTT